MRIKYLLRLTLTLLVLSFPLKADCLQIYDTITPVICYDSVYTFAGDTVYCPDTTSVLPSTPFVNNYQRLTLRGTDTIHTTIILTVNPIFVTAVADTSCEQYHWDMTDSIYRESTLAVKELKTQYSCDSIFYLNLTIHPAYHNNDTIGLCRYESVLYIDSLYHVAPDSIVDSFLTLQGCDSIHKVLFLLHDSLFRADWLIGEDSATWVSDSLLEVCSPFKFYGIDQSVHASSIMWLFDDGDSSTNMTVAHSYEPGTYQPSLIAVSPHGCLDTVTLSQPIAVFKSPTAGFFWDPKNPSDALPKTEFFNLSSPNDSSSHYLWFFQKSEGSEERDSSNALNPTYEWSVENMQDSVHASVQLVAYQDYSAPSGALVMCTDTLSDTVTILTDFLQFPNLVTPNGDGTNDTWVIVNLVEFGRYPINRLTIYDRWGHAVYDVENISSEEQFWDPAATRSPNGTYFYVFTGRGENDAYSIRRTGAIEVIGTASK